MEHCRHMCFRETKVSTIELRSLNFLEISDRFKFLSNCLYVETY